MAATAGYQAGFETNQTQLSYGVEATWGTKPAVQFQAIRYMSDTLALTKTRARPSEINISREVSQAVTTEQIAGGSINYALSYGVYDDFFASLVQGDWSAPFLIISSGTDITITTAGSQATATSTTAGKFTVVALGQYVKWSGWTGGFNGFMKVLAKPDNQTLTLQTPVAPATETSAGANVKLTGSTLNNGTTFKSLYLQKKFSSNKFLRYAGAYVTRMTLSVGVGNFFTGAFDIVAKSEASSTAEASTGATLVSPANTVFDPVAGWVAIRWPTQLVMGGSLDQFAMTVENTGAAPEFSLGGTAGAVGILGGTLMVSGTLRMYCADFSTVYDRFQNGVQGDLTIILRDAQLNSYVITMQDAYLMCRIPVGGPNQAVMVEVTFEGNPDPTIGGTIQFDRHQTTGS